jgi:hypothetical protein
VLEDDPEAAYTTTVSLYTPFSNMLWFVCVCVCVCVCVLFLMLLE